MTWTAQTLLSMLDTHLNVTLKDADVFTQALTHSSYANEKKLAFTHHYERLEFLGDAVLELVVSQRLLEIHPEKHEGELSKFRSGVVNEKVLSLAAKKLSLGEHIRFGKGEDKGRGAQKDSILADVFEALCAAIYLSNGMDATRKFVLHSLEEFIHTTSERVAYEDTKSLLQEHTQKYLKQVPEYRVVAAEGPDHSKTFVTEVWLKQKKWAKANGKSKKESEQNAARIALEKLTKLQREEKK